nr:MAG TPA: hypothetical protein [Caudoviricetes sp.]
MHTIFIELLLLTSETSKIINFYERSEKRFIM